MSRLSGEGTMNVASRRRGLTGIAVVLATLLAAVPFSLENFDWVPVLVLGLWLMTTAIVGGLIVAAKPGNLVGSLMVWSALGVALSGLLLPSYAEHAFEQGRGLPLAEAVAWMTLWTTIPSFILFIHLLLRFPTGRLPSPRWRWASRAALACALLTSLGYALRKGPIDVVPEVPNPLGAIAPAWISAFGITVGNTLLPVVAFLAVASLFVRYRRAAIQERQQMKWFIFAVSLFPVIFLISQFVQVLDDSEEEYLGFLVIAAGLLFVPVSMGIGILKHRLYDVDVVLNRALVYGALTGILGLAYLGIVVLLQRLLDPLTRESDLAIAASTLAVAALFRPLRIRVQVFIDRRFYRRKYDAVETLDRFTTHLRDEIELDALSEDLIAVVGETMQPTHASLWLRSEATL